MRLDVQLNEKAEETRQAAKIASQERIKAAEESSAKRSEAAEKNRRNQGFFAGNTEGMDVAATQFVDSTS